MHYAPTMGPDIIIIGIILLLVEIIIAIICVVVVVVFVFLVISYNSQLHLSDVSDRDYA